jgi:hypothetical protein
VVYQEKIGIIDQKILSYSPTVKGEIGFENSPGFQAQIDDLPLKYCILKENAKNNISGSSPHFENASETTDSAAKIPPLPICRNFTVFGKNLYTISPTLNSGNRYNLIKIKYLPDYPAWPSNCAENKGIPHDKRVALRGFLSATSTTAIWRCNEKEKKKEEE